MIGVVIGVRNRNTINQTCKAFMEAGATVVVVEQNNRQKFDPPEGCMYTFIQTSDVYSRSLTNNIGLALLKKKTHIWFSDADILIDSNVIHNLIPHLSNKKILFPKIEGYSTGVHTGNMIVPVNKVEEISFNEDLVGWGYEDDDFLHKCRAKGIEMEYGVNVGKITHLSSLVPEKPEHLFPGSLKWNNWGHNVIVSDYALGIPSNAPGFGAGDIRRSFPKGWMDKKDLYE